MSWDQDDKSKRAVVAQQLSRQDFWKSSFNIAFSFGSTTVIRAVECADQALGEYDKRFPFTATSRS